VLLAMGMHAQALLSPSAVERALQQEHPQEASASPCGLSLQKQGVARLRAMRIQATADSLILQGEVRLTYGDCILKTPEAILKGISANQGDLDQLDCPELHGEWLDSKGRLCRLDCSGPCQVLFEQGRALLTAAEGERLEYSDEDHLIESRTATLWFQLPQWRMERLHLRGDVRMRRRAHSESHAPSQLWAEDAEILWAEKVVVLAAQRPASVMLWNRGASQELACQRLRIWKDPLTQEWMQEAEGGVKVTLAGDVVHQLAHSYHDHEEEDEDDDADF
jgi:hypothetical protein